MVNGIVTAPELYVEMKMKTLKKTDLLHGLCGPNRGIYDNGRCVEVLTIGTDLTERKLAEIEIKKLLNEKEILLHMKFITALKII